MHDISDLERRGIPGVFVATVEFISAAQAQSASLGIDPARVYTEHPMQMLLEQVVIPRLPMTAKLGIRWFYSRPPVKGIEFEMDMRGVRRELIVALGGEAT